MSSVKRKGKDGWKVWGREKGWCRNFREPGRKGRQEQRWVLWCWRNMGAVLLPGGDAGRLHKEVTSIGNFRQRRRICWVDVGGGVKCSYLRKDNEGKHGNRKKWNCFNAKTINMCWVKTSPALGRRLTQVQKTNTGVKYTAINLLFWIYDEH